MLVIRAPGFNEIPRWAFPLRQTPPTWRNQLDSGFQLALFGRTLRARGCPLRRETKAFLPLDADAQGLTGALIGTVKDAAGGVMPGALVRVTCPALIGGARPSW